MALFDSLPLIQNSKFPLSMLILRQKSFWFCIPHLKTPQPVFPYYTNCHTSFSDYCKCQPIMVQSTCNATNSTIAENSWGSKLENVLVNSTWHYLYHPCHIWQMSILNDSSNFWNFYFWKKHCCCGNGGGTSQMSRMYW